MLSTEGKDVSKHGGAVMYDVAVVGSTTIISTGAVPPAPESFTFVTQSFFICLRALHLGFAKMTETYEHTMR